MKKLFLATMVLIALMMSTVSGQAAEKKQTETSKVEQELLDLSNQWMNAWMRRDSITLTRIIADDFTLTSWPCTWQLTSKSVWLDEALHKCECKSFGYDKMEVRIYGNAAVANSWYRQQAIANSQDCSGRFFVTDVWVKKDGRWQVVARHASPQIVPEPEPQN